MRGYKIEKSHLEVQRNIEGLSQEELAEALGIPLFKVKKLESLQITPIGDVACRLESMFNMNIDDLLSVASIEVKM